MLMYYVNPITFKRDHESVCHYCHKRILNKEEITVDHKTPVSRGGLSIKSNMVIACIPCNCEKSNMTENEYVKYLRLKKFCSNKQEIKNLRKLFLNNISEDAPDKELISGYGQSISIQNIKISRYMQNTPPREKKIEEIIGYYEKHKRLDKPIIVNINLVLRDGYARYLVAQQVGLKDVPVVYIA